jgi:fumarate hydratase class II
MSDAHRIEKDTFGPIEVPAERLWGAQTQRSLHHFDISTEKMPRELIRALALVKRCAAIVNRELGQLDASKAEAIVAAADEVLEGLHADEFPLSVWQTGSGTQTNMNANEVIANRAIQLAGGVLGSKQPVHPNDHVNRSQSSNDVFPTVMHIAAVEQVNDLLLPAVDTLQRTLLTKQKDFAQVTMLGRTHLQDATRMTLGQAISGWTTQLDDAAAGIFRALNPIHELALGGTAVGTGINAPAGFDAMAARCIADETGKLFVPAGNKFALLSAHDAMVTLSAALRTLAAALFKIANDVRWYASGPRSGIGELLLPENEPGSSIMPGKVNPTQCEALMQVAVQVYGNDLAVAFAGSQGNFQLNTFKPLMLHNVLESVSLLAEACASFEERCARGIEPNLKRMQQHVEGSLMLVTSLAPHIGYEKSAEIAQLAHREDLTLRDAALRLGYVTGEQFDEWVG